MNIIETEYQSSKSAIGANNPNFDIVVVGELNMDIIMDRVNRLPEIGKERIAMSMFITLGSSSAILASNASSLGLNVAFIGRVGNDIFGKQITHILDGRGLDVMSIITSEKLQTGLTFIYTYENDRGMITYPGAMEEMTIKDIDWEKVRASRHLHMSSYYLQKGIRPDCLELFKRAKALGLGTSLDTNWDPDENWGEELYEVLKYVDVFLPNDAEAKLISKKKRLDDALAHLASFGSIVVATCGSEGVIARAGDTVYHVSAIKVTPVDAVGAGDSFSAGFLKNYVGGLDLRACLELGVTTGAYSTLKSGGTAAFEDMDSFQLFFDKVKSQINITVTNISII